MIRQWEELSWQQAGEMDPERTVALLPIAAVEAHGPHLPLGTDGIIAAAMAREAAQRLQVDGLGVVVLPPLAYAAAPFAAGFAGTISVGARDVTATVADVGRALASRVACLGLANAHLDPAHLASLRAAAESLREVVPVAFPDLTRRALAERLGEEFRSGACHAGRFETSIVLAERPDLVREEARRRLEPNPSSLSEAIRAGKRSFEEAGLPEAWCGDPAAATAEEGREWIAVLGAILAEAVEDVVVPGRLDSPPPRL